MIRLSYLLLFLTTFSLSLCQPLFAHSEAHVARYVAINSGIDTGHCKDSHNPCKTLSYAITKAAKGDFIKVAAGQYQIEGSELFALLSDVIVVTGGYNVDNHFSLQDAEKNPTIIIGLPYQYRDLLATNGFRLLRDKKLSKLSAKSLQTFERFQKLKKISQAEIPCTNGKAGDYSCANVTLLSRVSLNELSSESSAVNDIWGYTDLNDNSEYALVGTNQGTAIVNITQAESPQVVSFISGPSSAWRDIKTYQYLNQESGRYEGYAYVTNESSGGLQVINLSELPTRATLTRNITEFTTAHNVYISNVDYATSLALDGSEAFLYISGSNKQQGVFRVFSLADPSSPALIATPENTGYIHDGASLLITDDRRSVCQNPDACEVFIDFNENTVDLWDLSNKNSPSLLSRTPYSGSQYTHSGWSSDDGNTIFIQDELDEQNLGLRTTLRAMDISNLRAPSLISTWTGASEAIDHNGFAKGDRYYMSNYRRGLTILDISDPSNMKQVALFDTFPLPSANFANFDGAWGTYPFLPSGNIIVSDIQYGLFTLREDQNTTDSTTSKAEFLTGSLFGEGSSEVTMTVRRLAPFEQALTVSYQTYDDTASSGSHYTNASGELSWAANDSSDKTITLSLLTAPTDQIREFTLQLESDNPAQLGTITQAKVAINRVITNNTPGTVTPTPNSGGGGGSFNLSILLLLLFTAMLRKRLLKNAFIH